MDMRVDAAGKDAQPGRVDLLTVLSEVRPDLSDPAVPDPDVSRFDAVGGDHRPAADDHVRARRSRKRPSTSIATDTSAAVTDSAGLWLTPPLQRTKSMQAPGRADIATASLPAPLVISNGCCFEFFTAWVSSDTSRGSHRTAAFSLSARISTASLRRLASSRVRTSSVSQTSIRTRSSA